jgi:DNA helicase-2/ATP-dependent DNA helicase PcrA
MQERITLHAAPTDRAEAEFVVHSIEQLIGGHSFFSIDSGRTTDTALANLSFADFAVLYRTDAQSAVLAEALARSGMPFAKHSHQRLAENPFVRALLPDLDEKRDVVDGEMLTAAAARLAQSGEPSDAGDSARILQQLKLLAEAGDGDRAGFVDAVALASEADGWDPRADRVSLLTLHAAKGVEFPVVFIVGLEDGLLPLKWGDGDDAALAEERRLLYVGMTRAKDRLILSRALQRPWRGRVRQLEPSPFLRDIENELMRQERTRPTRRRPEDAQLTLL